MKCFICNLDFNKQNGRHIYYCAKINGLLFNNNELRYKQICFEKNINFTMEFMQDLYLNKGYSLPDFKKEFNLNYAQSQFLLSYFKIEKRNLNEANSAEGRQYKFKKTCQERYGVSNVSLIEDVKEQKRQTFIKNYGVDNIRKSDVFKKWYAQFMVNTYGKGSLSNRYGGINEYWKNIAPDKKKYICDKMHEGYRVYWSNLSQDEKEAIIQKRTRNLVAYYNSSIEQLVANALDCLGIYYSRQWWIRRKSYDFCIKDTKIIIEVNGDYWHANPKKYLADDILNHHGVEYFAKDIWEKDIIKTNNALKYGYIVLTIWESDLIKISDLDIQKIVLDLLKEHYYVSDEDKIN